MEPEKKRAKLEESAAMLRLNWTREEVVKAKEEFSSALPFPHYSLPGLVVNENDLNQLQEEVMEELFYVKENDLFSFVQSGDLAKSSKPHLQKFVKGLYSEDFRDVISEITGVQGLTDKFDLTSSVYSFTNNLLCHDDELSSRRIAFILYLVPKDWVETDGGALELFTVDENKQPNGVYKRILPQRNSMLFFEVSDRSYHQVAEVLSKDKNRVSIGGWFHGPKVETPSGWKPVEPLFNQVAILSPPRFEPVGEEADVDIQVWVNAIYLAESTQKQIREKFEEDSCILLEEFLSKEKYDVVKEALAECQAWQPVGPFQKQRYDVLGNQVSSSLEELKGFFMSKQFVQLVADLTSLSVETAAQLVRRIAPGSYTLVHDRSKSEKEAHKEELDICWTHVENNQAWEDEDHSPGGKLVYACEGEEEPLLVVSPKGNMLSIVFRADPDTQAFVKYVNTTAPSPRYDLFMVSTVAQDEENEDDN